MHFGEHLCSRSEQDHAGSFVRQHQQEVERESGGVALTTISQANGASRFDVEQERVRAVVKYVRQ